MRKPIPLRLDHDAAGLRGLARASGTPIRSGDCWRWH